MILTYDAIKTLAKTVYELRAMVMALNPVRGVAKTQVRLASIGQSIELIVTQAVSGTVVREMVGATERAHGALTQKEVNKIWMLMREGKSQ